MAALALTACGGKAATTQPPPQAVQRDVAERFAAAVFRGDSTAARALLVRPDEAALLVRLRRAAAPWRKQHASIRASARLTGGRWTFGYAAKRTHADGRFETERGDLVVVVAPSAAGAGVRYFALAHVRTRFSTHQDAELLPSKR